MSGRVAFCDSIGVSRALPDGNTEDDRAACVVQLIESTFRQAAGLQRHLFGLTPMSGSGFRLLSETRVVESIFPGMCDVRQHFQCTQVTDIPGTVRSELELLNLDRTVHAGQSVAITAGSRGIANIALILREIAAYFSGLGAHPFVVPAMGSHGGGTVEGQLKILRGFGITEDFLGVPIRATMETVVVAETRNGLPVHFDRFAAHADHVFVCNRVKPHTRFVGPIESGLHKMMLIGLGKHEGAKIYHRGILEMSFPDILESVAARVLEVCRVAGGLAIVENALDQTALLSAVAPAEFAERETELLELANRWLPRLPFPDVDLLIIDEIGKNISGVGMDANVVGRKFSDHLATDRDLARCRRILVRSLTPETGGNATGIGMAEFTTRRCVEQIDSEITRINCVTGLHPEAAMIPITLPTDAAAVACALETIGLVKPEAARVVQIRNTLHLTSVRVSEAYLDEVNSRDDLDLVDGPFAFPVDEDGCLRDVRHDIPTAVSDAVS